MKSKGSIVKALENGDISYDWMTVKSGNAEFRMLRDAPKIDGVRITGSAYDWQQFADCIDACLPTAKLLDLRWEQADIRIDPQTKYYRGGVGMDTAKAVDDHSRRIDRATGNRHGSIADVGKHWILHDRLSSVKAVLYGWHVLDSMINPKTGVREWSGIKVTPSVSDPNVHVIQNVSTAHGYRHHDYSMTGMVVARDCLVDGAGMRLEDVLSDPGLCHLVRASGRYMTFSRLPGVHMCEDTDRMIGTLVLDVGTATLEQAMIALENGVKEHGRNRGPVVDQYLGHFGIAPPANWCASALGYWLHRACEGLGCDTPIAGSAGARATMGQFMKIGRWVPRDKLTVADLVPGNVPIWWRESPLSWKGHIGIIERLDDDRRTMHTIEGNSGKYGDRVARMERSMHDTKLLGVGILSTGPKEYQPTSYQLEEAGRLMKLGAEVMLGDRRDPLENM